MPLTYEDLNNLRQHCFHNYGQELPSEVTRDLTVQYWDDRFRTLGNPERDFFISFHPEDIIQVSYQDDIWWAGPVLGSTNFITQHYS